MGVGPVCLALITAEQEMVGLIDPACQRRHTEAPAHLLDPWVRMKRIKLPMRATQGESKPDTC